MVEGQRIVCWDRRREIILDEKGVIEKFGVSPESIPDYLALVGDSAVQRIVHTSRGCSTQRKSQRVEMAGRLSALEEVVSGVEGGENSGTGDEVAVELVYES